MEGTPTQGPRITDRPAPPTPPASTAGQAGQAGGGGLGESRSWLGSHGLKRPRQGRVIAGVCAGLARRFGMPVFLVRVLTVAAALAGFPVIVYIALWVLMPKED